MSGFGNDGLIVCTAPAVQSSSPAPTATVTVTASASTSSEPSASPSASSSTSPTPTASPSAEPSDSPNPSPQPSLSAPPTCDSTHAAAASETEPNDAPPCSQILTAATTGSRDLSGSIYPIGDTDWFQLPVVPGGRVLARTACNFDTVIDVVTADGTVLETNDDANGTLCSELTGTNLLPAQAAYLRVRAYQNASAGPYTLTYMTSAVACANAYDADNAPACATRVTESQVAVSGGIPDPVDEDWFRYALPAGGSVTLQTSTGGGGCTSDTTLRVIRESGIVAGDNDDFGGTLCSRLSFTVAPGERFFVRVDSFNTTTVPSYTLTRS
ncbi:MAG: hypothetical protein ABR520_04380 [Mycobacteriales bacterium]